MPLTSCLLKLLLHIPWLINPTPTPLPSGYIISKPHATIRFGNKKAGVNCLTPSAPLWCPWPSIAFNLAVNKSLGPSPSTVPHSFFYNVSKFLVSDCNVQVIGQSLSGGGWVAKDEQKAFHPWGRLLEDAHKLCRFRQYMLWAPREGLSAAGVLKLSPTLDWSFLCLPAQHPSLFHGHPDSPLGNPHLFH